MKFFGLLRKAGGSLFYFLGETIRTILNTILGGIAYLLGIGPVWLVSRLVGKDFLELKFKPNTKSYWIKAKTPSERSDYFRQF